MRILILPALFVANNAMAVEPAAWQAENGITITPLLKADLRHDNNILNNSTDEKSSTILELAPSVNFLAEDGVNRYEVNAGLTKGLYFSSSEDNFLNASLDADAHFEASRSLKFDLSAGFASLSESRGSGLTEGNAESIDAPLEYNKTEFAAAVEYGVLSTPLRLKADVALFDKAYQNFEEVTRTRDYDSNKLGATLFYRMSDRTDGFVEYSVNRIRYDVIDTGGSRDSDDARLSLGATWNITAITAGQFKLGYQDKTFDNPLREDFSGVSWEGSMTWSPLTYSSFELGTSRAARDPNVEGNYIKESSYNASWNHTWRNDLSTTLGLNLRSEDYQGVAREDDMLDYRVAANYAFRRWLDASVYFVHTDKSSTRTNIEYDKQVFGINFMVSM